MTMDWDEGFYRLNEAYVKAVMEAGGIPVGLPYAGEDDGERIINTINGLLLSGGGDINPILYGEEPLPRLGRVITERDEREIQWTIAAIQKKIPILAVCRGLQILNVALGGTVYQDLYAQKKRETLLHSQTSLRHETSHFVHLREDSKLYKIANTKKIAVNSFHHQAIKEAAKDLAIVGVASDGIVEAAEHKTLPFCLGVQWHPEALAVNGDPMSLALFRSFIAACRKEK
ncbi:gamma-glutamyl-gamma-aminobutyrate hydrolase family protein [Ureibacillus sp. FSL K6-8385]|uniref:gamma-glutamyl-gamma-aminobutyrate hydrolase family protein n=1 Tax=Ureibacillus TaxID=160795 RepID=UPI00248320E2|nr:gamma-glutamyl-gamma-aminobutyrate hydrolase family protein [Ureibacillus terrenus]MED3660519.1 gamma-glutamyl-gamma-aminobutyrate hydrolase family protein [Ureibacillus terrenus]MED3762672.1 gamma-glutamyl-gamma-aminobutyrate hydrolase family protein [Ureibacillus terrenus]